MTQRGIQTAMPAAVDRLQGQVRQRHQPLGREQRINQLKPRVCPAGRTAVQRGAEALQLLQPLWTLAPSIRPEHTPIRGHHAPPSTWSYSGASRGGRPASSHTPTRLKAKLSQRLHHSLVARPGAQPDGAPSDPRRSASRLPPDRQVDGGGGNLGVGHEGGQHRHQGQQRHDPDEEPTSSGSLDRGLRARFIAWSHSRLGANQLDDGHTNVTRFPLG